MTMKEFARKYDIPYPVVYKASFRVHPVSSVKREKDYPEEDLLRETERFANQRIKECKRYISEYQDVIDKIKTKKK